MEAGRGWKWEQAGLVPTCDGESRGTSHLQRFGEQGVPNPNEAPQPSPPVPGKGVPTTWGCGDQQGFLPDEPEGCWLPGLPLKGPTRTSVLTLTCSERGRWGAAQKCQGHRGALNSLAQGEGRRASPLPSSSFIKPYPTALVGGALFLSELSLNPACRHRRGQI